MLADPETVCTGLFRWSTSHAQPSTEGLRAIGFAEGVIAGQTG